MIKRLLFGIIAAGFLVGGSACYKEVMDMEADPLRPEYVVPAVRDKLTVEKLLSRVGESTAFEYEADGTCVAVYKEKRELAITGMNPRVTTIPGETSEDLEITTSQDHAKFKTRWELLANREVSEAYFDSKSERFGVTVWYEHTVPGQSSTFLEGNIKIGGFSKGFSVKINEHGFIDLKQQIDDAEAYLRMKDGANYNVLTYEFTSLRLTGNTDSKIRLHAQITFRNLFLRKAIGHVPAATPAPTEKTNINYNLDVFSTASSAKFSLPDASIRFTAKKAASLPVALYVGKIMAKPGNERDDLEGSPLKKGLEVKNKDLTTLPEEEKNKALQITTDPTTPLANSLAGAAEKTLELNKENSNISDVFSNGLYSIEVSDVYISSVTAGPSTEDKELPLDGVVNLEIEVRMPFFGTITKAVMNQKLAVTAEAFPAKYLDYLQNPGNPDEVKDAIVLHIGFLNNLPLEGYAELNFVDKSGNSVLKLGLNNEKTLEGRSIFIPCGEVGDNGRVSKPAFTEHHCNLSRGDYERLSKNASSLQISYIFTTPNADQNKNVRILKDDELVLQLALEVKGYIAHPLDFIDSMKKNK